MGAGARGQTTSDAVALTMVITAIVYALGASVTFIWLKERAVAAPASDNAPANANALANINTKAESSISRLIRTAREASRYRDLILVFLCGTFYQAGVATVVTLAAIYAQEVMGFKTQDTLVLVLVVNITACIGAFGFGYLQDLIGKKRALAITLVGWMAMVFFAWFATTPGLFWIAANLAGVCMGSSQSAGRALVAYFSPAERAGEFFGLWGVATRLAAVLGPLTYGVVTWITDNNHRLAMLITGVFFLLALVVLMRVNEQRGRAAVAA